MRPTMIRIPLPPKKDKSLSHCSNFDELDQGLKIVSWLCKLQNMLSQILVVERL